MNGKTECGQLSRLGFVSLLWNTRFLTHLLEWGPLAPKTELASHNSFYKCPFNDLPRWIYQINSNKCYLNDQ